MAKSTAKKKRPTSKKSSSRRLKDLSLKTATTRMVTGGRRVYFS
jgi:hypothetical protein